MLLAITVRIWHIFVILFIYMYKSQLNVIWVWVKQCKTDDYDMKYLQNFKDIFKKRKKEFDKCLLL